MQPAVGLVVNPSASRDIRRLTSLARTVDVHERVNQVARILQGLAACSELVAGGLGPVRYMPESCRVVERAHEEIAHAGLLRRPRGEARRGDDPTPDHARLALDPVLPKGAIADDAVGTIRAAAAMARSGARCVVTVGGDGTNRAVAAGWPDAVICAVPGGTNNAFAPPLDPVAAGLAAGLFAADPTAFAAYARALPRLVVRAGEGAGKLGASFAGTFALVDVAVVRGAWVGAHAVWDPATLVEAVVSRADPTVSGLAGLAGMVRPLPATDPEDSPCAVHLLLGSTDIGLGGNRPSSATEGAAADRRTVLAPLGPGQLVPVVVRGSLVLATDETVRLGPYAETVTLAFDGERELVVGPGTPIDVRIARSPLRLLDAVGLLRGAADRGALLLPGAPAGT
jgi:predicted polyphosphate/ATP-dependent NAD kinase